VGLDKWKMDDMMKCQHNFIASFYNRIKLIRVCMWQWQNLCKFACCCSWRNEVIKPDLKSNGLL